MARPISLDIDPANVDADGLAAANDSTGTSVTLDGALTSGGTFTAADGLARQLSITDSSTVDQSGVTFTVTGTDADGNAQTEAITGPAADATVESAKYFKTVTSVAIASPALACTVNIGTVDEVASQTIPLNIYAGSPAAVVAELTGTMNYSIQVTNSDIQSSTRGDQDSFTWAADANWSGITASQAKELVAENWRAMRFIANSYTDTAEIQLAIQQPGAC